jgi:Leucine-rich repeat (LRR) protein
MPFKLLCLENPDNFNKIVKIDLDLKNICEISDSILKFKNLEEIILRRNPDLDIEKAISFLSNFDSLKVLDISSCKITELPKEIYKLERLEKLVLINNRIKIIPIEISLMKNLKKIDLSANEGIDIEDLFEKLAIQNTINVIGIGRNKIETIPCNIVKLTNLQELSIVGNEISSVPLCFGESNISILIIADNPLKSFSEIAQNMKSLKLLEISLSNASVEEEIKLKNIMKTKGTMIITGRAKPPLARKSSSVGYLEDK